MSYEKKIQGKFVVEYSETAKKFTKYCIGLGYHFSYKENESTGVETITVKFDNDSDYDSAVQTFVNLEEDNNPQINLLDDNY